MFMVKKDFNKSSLAPLADRVASSQLMFLILNSPAVVVLNNYKSSLLDLDSLRVLVRHNDGFAYHPNKNIKTRAFKGLSTVLSLDVLNGLVVFIFFKEPPKAWDFLNKLKNENFHSLTYFSLILNGHLANSTIFHSHLKYFRNNILLSLPVFELNKRFIQIMNNPLVYSLNKIYLILNAYTESIVKGVESL